MGDVSSANRSCRYDFMSFSSEKLLSAEATVTGAVQTITGTMHTSGQTTVFFS
jgi:hypothetical protein